LSTISINDLGTWSIKPQYTLRGSQTIQTNNTVDVGTDEKPPVCTNEEWDKFCEEEGLEDGNNGYSTYTSDIYTNTVSA
jgi:hypothetical protein